MHTGDMKMFNRLQSIVLTRRWSALSWPCVKHCGSYTPQRGRVSKVPQHPVDAHIEVDASLPQAKVDLQQVRLLEKLSLVDFANTEGIKRLEAAIRLANHLSAVNTEGVDPMITVLENRSLALAEDEVTSGDMSEELLDCAAKTLEDYFVVPPGNINFAQEDGYYHKLGDKK